MSNEAESNNPKNDLDQACHAFYEEWLDGKNPCIDSLIERFPVHQNEIRSRVKKFMVTYRYFEETRGEREGEAPELARDTTPQGEDKSGRTLGDFRLIREIGRGGMGVVYEARQISLDRTVALKVLPAHLTLQEKVIQRFQREAATAAKLKHPGIVGIYAVGDDDGHHYFAMEFVEGAPLDQVIARSETRETMLKDASFLGRSILKVRHHLSDHEKSEDAAELNEYWRKSHIEASCRIMAQVADALEYAHKAGVIHRDIKPSNILVTENGSIKLVDFGLAHVEGHASLTITGQLSGTPHYFAPELASRQQESADQQTDLYALGVTLYELLTLTRPFEGRTSQEILNNIIAREPSSPRLHNTLIPRDLETICMTAVEKSRSRRYASAWEFEDDLSRFLTFKPIKAQPAGLGTHVYRLARRNPAYTTICGLLFLLVVVGPLIFGIQQKLSGDRIRKALLEKEDALLAKDNALKAVGHERDAKEVALIEKEEALKQKVLALNQAEQEATMATQVSDFMMGLFRGSDPFFSRGREMTAYDLLQRGAAMIKTELTDQIEVQVRLMGIIGASYKNIGYLDEAEKLFDKALEISLTELGEAHELSIGAWEDLADLHLVREDAAKAELLLTAALSQIRNLHDGDTKTYIGDLECGILQLLGQTYVMEGKLEEAEHIFNRIVSKVRNDSKIEARPCKRKVAMCNLGSIYADKGRMEEAESILIRAKEISSKDCPCGRCEDFQRTAATTLGNLYARMGKLDEAKRYLVESYEQTVRDLGEDHFMTHHQAMDVALLYLLMNRLEESETLCLKSIQGYRKTLGGENPIVIRASSLLVKIYIKQTRFEEAEALLIDCINKNLRIEKSAFAEGSYFYYVHFRNESGKSPPLTFDESSPMVNDYNVSIPFEPVRLTVLLRDQLRELYAMQGRIDDIVDLYEKAIVQDREAFGADFPAELNGLQYLADALISTGRYEDVIRILKEFPSNHPACLRLYLTLYSIKNSPSLNISPEVKTNLNSMNWKRPLVMTDERRRITLLTVIKEEVAQAFLKECESACREIEELVGFHEEENSLPITIFLTSNLEEYNRSGNDFGDARSSIYPVFFVEETEESNPYSVTYFLGDKEADVRFASGLVRHAVIEQYLNRINENHDIPAWFIKGQSAKIERYFHPEYIRWSLQAELIPLGGLLELKPFFSEFGFTAREIHLAGLICAYLDSEEVIESVKTAFAHTVNAIRNEKDISESFRTLENAIIENEESLRIFFKKY